MKTDAHFLTLGDGRKLLYYRPLPHKITHSLAELVPPDYSKLEVEIGCGTGRFLSTRAEMYPDRFFVGIDKKMERVTLTSEKIEKRGLTNCKLIRCDARTFLGQKLPALEALHVYHPDPWPKRRHHKHRFFRSPDAKHWCEAIRKGGELRISTDQNDYFEEILAVVNTWKLFDLNLTYVKRSGAPQSRFEEIFLNKKLPVFKAYFKKKN